MSSLGTTSFRPGFATNVNSIVSAAWGPSKPDTKHDRNHDIHDRNQGLYDRSASYDSQMDHQGEYVHGQKSDKRKSSKTDNDLDSRQGESSRSNNTDAGKENTGFQMEDDSLLF